MTKQVTLRGWPNSQPCMDCIHGHFVDFSDKDSTSAHQICMINKLEQDDDCPETDVEIPYFVLMDAKGNPAAIVKTEYEAKQYLKDNDNYETDTYYKYLKVPFIKW